MRRLVASKRRMAAAAGAVVLVLAVSVAGALYLDRDESDQNARDARETASTVSAPPGALTVTLAPVVEGLIEPDGIVAIPGSPGRLAVLERRGVVRTITNGALDPSPLLDITSLTTIIDLEDTEAGLIGLAFHPRFREQRPDVRHLQPAAGDQNEGRRIPRGRRQGRPRQRETDP